MVNKSCVRMMRSYCSRVQASKWTLIHRTWRLNLHTDYEHVLHQCILDGNVRSLQVRLNLPTVRLCVLSIDGGGPRGVIPLKIWSCSKRLWDRAPESEIACPLHRYVVFVVFDWSGTRSNQVLCLAIRSKILLHLVHVCRADSSVLDTT
ncbi:hypothetical protein BO85DRAFT_208116 [Aspergillus piperis CBS 112811]|uniref:Uncharacterized protein n=1 Tax=Aspergillus piperis CBS 112811 TaxID=1448313 RepID=A0A8G1QR68_9EURO|nr:hypothetical protein BO85DRAFT_208116 [Aspergillus piperis CBS 112811]RAH52318.1 hypothetical protein BO85DRAFT_208116 [Aspergillus piperis CBS 112811]